MGWWKHVAWCSESVSTTFYPLICISMVLNVLISILTFIKTATDLKYPIRRLFLTEITFRWNLKLSTSFIFRWRWNYTLPTGISTLSQICSKNSGTIIQIWHNCVTIRPELVVDFTENYTAAHCTVFPLNLLDHDKMLFYCKIVSTHTAHTIVSWLNLKQWVVIHILPVRVGYQYVDTLIDLRRLQLP